LGAGSFDGLAGELRSAVLPFAFRDGIPIVLLGDGIYLVALHMTFVTTANYYYY
jgi:hypothetical protein